MIYGFLNFFLCFGRRSSGKSGAKGLIGWPISGEDFSIGKVTGRDNHDPITGRVQQITVLY
jgi:hypothetical protein